MNDGKAEREAADQAAKVKAERAEAIRRACAAFKPNDTGNYKSKAQKQAEREAKVASIHSAAANFAQSMLLHVVENATFKHQARPK